MAPADCLWTVGESGPDWRAGAQSILADIGDCAIWGRTHTCGGPGPTRTPCHWGSETWPAV